MRDFDYGVDLLENNFKLWPTEGKMTALLDADAFPYIVGYTTEEDTYAKSLSRGLPIEETPEFKNACNHVSYLVNDWVQKAGCDSAKLYLTEGKENFRFRVAVSKPYKGNRKTEKPPFFYELKEFIKKDYNAIVALDCEADDLMSIEVWDWIREQGIQDRPGQGFHKEIARHVIVSKDKDLKIVPGWHLDPTGINPIVKWSTYIGELIPTWKDKEVNDYEHWPIVNGTPIHPDKVESLGIRPDRYARGDNKGKLKTKRVCVGKKVTQYISKLKGTGLKFFYAQLLMGDSTDNYAGVPKVGDTKAYDLLDEISTEDGMFEIVRAEYEQYYGFNKFWPKMLETGQLAWMQTFRGEMWHETDDEDDD